MKKTLSILLCLTLLLSVFPVAVFADGVKQGVSLLATAGDSVYVDIEDLFIDRRAEINVAITSANTITEDAGTLELSASVTAINPDEAGLVTTTDVIWTIDNTLISKLEGNVLTAIGNGTVNVTATSVYDKEKSATYTVTITGQPEKYLVSFDKGTGADVENMPQTVLALDEYNVPTDAPTRGGNFKFLGWKTSLDSDELVTTINVEDDVTLYAAWAKGTVIEFNKESDKNLFTYNSYFKDVKVEDGLFKFTTGPNATAGKLPDPQISLSNIDASQYRYMEFLMGMDAASQKMKVYYSTPSSTAYSEDKTIELPITGTLDELAVVKFDFWSRDNTKVVMPNLRIDVGEKEGAVTYIDYIRIKNDSVETVEIEDVVVPEAGKVPATTATSSEPEKYTVESVTWTPELLYDYYFDGNVPYTANITIKPVVGYVLSDDVVFATVNGQTATYVLNDDGTATVSYTFTETEELGDVSVAELTFNMGDASTLTRTLFVGEKVDLSSYLPTYVPEGYRFAGWSTIDGNASKVKNSVVASVDTQFYAIYDKYDKFNFYNLYHSYGVTSNAGLSFRNGYAVVTPESATQSTYLETPELNLPASQYGFAKVTVDAELGGIYDDRTHTNQFKADSTPALSFSLMADSQTFVGSGVVVDAIENTANGTITYVYDMAQAQTWAGQIGKLNFDPYDGYPVWAVQSIELVENEVIYGDVVINELDAPETWIVPDVYAAGENFVVTNVEWTGEFYENGTFKAETAYTATVTLKTKSGYAFDADCVAYIGNVQADETVVDTVANTITATYTFTETDPLAEIEVVVSGADKISRNGRYMEYTAAVYALDGSVIPVKDVVWSVVNNEENEDEKIRATITETGRLTPIISGKVDVIATSVYDPNVFGVLTVTLENQSETCTVYFDKNTQAEVTGMPEAVGDVKGTFNVATAGSESDPKRTDGYYFVGWATSDETAQTVTSVTVNKDTTLYAVWEKTSWGLEFDENDPETACVITGNPTISDDAAPGTYKFVTTVRDTYFTYTLDPQSVKATPENAKLKFRFATNASHSTQTSSFFTTKFENGEYKSGPYLDPYKSQYLASQVSVDYSSAGVDDFVTIVADFSTKAGWAEYVDTLRLDFFETDNNVGSTVVWDYVRLIDESRTLTLNANGGQFESGETKTITGKQGHISFSDVPTKENCQFMGWSKDPESMDNLYTSSVYAMDDLTLYAMWSPAPQLAGLDAGQISETVTAEDEAQVQNINVTSNADGLNITSTDVVRPIVNIADSISANPTNNTLMVKLEYSYSNMTYGELAIRFKQAESQEFTYITIKNPMPRSVESATYYSAVLSEEDGYTGTVTEVALVLPEGQIKSMSIYEVAMTGETAANIKIESFRTQELPDSGSVSTSNPATDPKTGFEKTVWDEPVVVAPIVAPQGSTQTTPVSNTIEKFEYVNVYNPTMFADVLATDWFYGDVEKTYSLGFMDGVSANTFDPNGSVTIAQAITIAARIHATYNKETITAVDGAEWYMPYLNYALDKGIITSGQYEDVTAVATRRQVAYILYCSMKPEWFNEINKFDSVPDVSHNAHDYNAILALYNAGIIQGVDEAYNFAPEANIRRCELSAIINRIALPESRITIE